MRLIIVILLFCFTDCNIAPLRRTSFWETQKENFKYRNKYEFVSDSTLWVNYKTLKKNRRCIFLQAVAIAQSIFYIRDKVVLQIVFVNLPNLLSF